MCPLCWWAEISQKCQCQWPWFVDLKLSVKRYTFANAWSRGWSLSSKTISKIATMFVDPIWPQLTRPRTRYNSVFKFVFGRYVVRHKKKRRIYSRLVMARKNYRERKLLSMSSRERFREIKLTSTRRWLSQSSAWESFDCRNVVFWLINRLIKKIKYTTLSPHLHAWLVAFTLLL